jgi:protoporphyrinogen/coproporphyrinogen III oxidase
VTPPWTVAVIGGGISGLATALALLEQAESRGLALRCTVLEAEPAWGGKIVTHRLGDLITEAGPDSFLSNKPGGLQLVAKLGLTDELVNTNETGKKAFVYSRGRLRELPEGLIAITPGQVGPFLKSGLLSLSGVLRMGLDLVLPANRSAGDESLASFIRRRFGGQAFDRLMEPLMAGIYAGDAEQMSVRATFPRFVELEQAHGSVLRGMLAARATRNGAVEGQRRRTMFVTLRAGLDALVTALVRRLTAHGVTMRARAPVESLRVRSHQLGRWTYDVMMHDGSALSADSLVLATPAFVTSELLRPLTPIAAGLIEMIPYSSTATIALAYPASVIGASIRGFGFVVPRIERRELIAATWTSLKWPNRAPPDQLLARCYVGGEGRESILELDDEAMVARVRRELSEICGLEAEPTFTEVNRWIKAMPQYRLGHLERVEQAEVALSRYGGLIVTGSAYRGVGIPDCIRDGALAAEKVIRYLGGERV